MPLANSVWPMLEQTATVFRKDEGVIDGVLEVYSKMIRSLQSDMAPRLPAVASMLVSTFQETQFQSALLCTQVTVEVFGKGPPEVQASFKDMLGLICQVGDLVSPNQNKDKRNCDGIPLIHRM